MELPEHCRKWGISVFMQGCVNEVSKLPKRKKIHNVNRNVKALKFEPGNRTQKWSVHFKILMECPQDLSLWAKILTKSPRKSS